MEKVNKIEQVEHARLQNASSDSEKAASQPAYPMNEEDYQVTYATLGCKAICLISKTEYDVIHFISYTYHKLTLYHCLGLKLGLLLQF